jgi:glycosyltransferase involved in cell wall biosynthesis
MSDLFIGFGRSALEGMASARSVIIAGNQGYIGLLDQTNIETAIKTNFSGRGQAMTSPETFLKDILKAVSLDEGQREALGAFCRATVEQQYSIKKMVDDNIDVYMQLLQNS